ncbi:MAG: hypothetical protein ACREOO_00160 [bacterium]
MKALHAILCSLSSLLVLSCDSSAPLNDQLVELGQPIDDVEVTQVWRYASWEKPYFGTRAFTGDTTTIRITAREPGTVTLFERTVHADSSLPADTATVKFQREGSLWRQIGENRSRLYGFLAHHDGVLYQTNIDSNHVVVDLDTSLFLIRQQTGKNHFVGHSDRVRLFCDTYDHVNVYYDETPTYYDGFGHLAIHSPREGLVATIYFGGFSSIEQHGYQLIRH